MSVNNINSPMPKSCLTVFNIQSDHFNVINNILQTKVNKYQTINNKVLLGNIVINKTDIGLGNVNNISDSNKPISIAQQNALNLKENISNKGVANGYVGLDELGKISLSQLPSGLTGGLNFKGVWDASSNTPNILTNNCKSGDFYKVNVDGNTNIDDITQWNIGDMAIKSNETWFKIDNSDIVSSVNGKIGIVNLLKSDVGLENVDNTSDVNKPVSSSVSTQLDLKVDKTITVNGQPLSENVVLIKGNVGLGNVDNTSDANKPISTLATSALNLKADKSITVNNKPLSANVVLTSADISGFNNVDNTSDVNKPVSTAQQNALNLKVDKSITVNSKPLSSNVVLTSSDISGFNNVDNTSDVNKPVSTAQQNALNLKVDKTITVNNKPLSTNVVLTSSDISGFNNVDNTSDVNKPVSTAQQNALNLKVDKTITVNSKPLSANVVLTSTDISGLNNALNLKEDKSNKGVSGGYASLDDTGRVPTYQLPITGGSVGFGATQSFWTSSLPTQVSNMTTYTNSFTKTFYPATSKIIISSYFEFSELSLHQKTATLRVFDFKLDGTAIFQFDYFINLSIPPYPTDIQNKDQYRRHDFTFGLSGVSLANHTLTCSFIFIEEGNGVANSSTFPARTLLISSQFMYF